MPHSVISRLVWLQLNPDAAFDGAGKQITFLSLILFTVSTGVRRTDLQMRRDFAARELMLMLIQEQAHIMEFGETDAL